MACLLKQLSKKVFSFNTCKYCSTHSNYVEEIVEFSNGRNLKLQSPLKTFSGANGKAEVNIGETVVSATVVGKEKPVTEGFLPLTVNYNQDYASNVSFSRAKGMRVYNMNKEILTGRAIDRSIRPLFAHGLNCEIQLTCDLMSSHEFDPDVIAINAASACLATSDIPWNGPIAAVRVGHVNGKIITIPTIQELADSDLNLVVVAGKNKKIVMLEGSGKPVHRTVLKKAISTAVNECQPIIKAIEILSKGVGNVKQEMTYISEIPNDILETVRLLTETRIRDIFMTYTHDKHSRDKAVKNIQFDVIEKLKKHFKSQDDQIFNEAFKNIVNEVFRKLILTGNMRVDGRKLDELRPISCDVNVYPKLHGSSRFKRGQTHVNCLVKLDSPAAHLGINPLTGIRGKFDLTYKFPSYAVGEISTSIKVSRREVGHAALARKALAPIIPDIPFGIMLSSKVEASNGSSSMATVCGGSIALMDAGIHLTSPASGVAIGLVAKIDEGEIKEYKLLTDLMGFEDYAGDMDFKLASTKNGITALQADIKIAGLPTSIVFESIDKALVANKDILNIMKNTIAEPNTDKTNLPVIAEQTLSAGQRILLMRNRGQNLHSLEAKTGAIVEWDTENDSAISVFAPNQNSLDEALKIIAETIADDFTEPAHGQICTVVIREVLDFGVMVELLPGMKSVLLKNAHLHTKKISHASDLNLKVGDSLTVQYFGRDPVSGHMRMSRKTLMIPGSSIIAKKVKA